MHSAQDFLRRMNIFKRRTMHKPAHFLHSHYGIAGKRGNQGKTGSKEKLFAFNAKLCLFLSILSNDCFSLIRSFVCLFVWLFCILFTFSSTYWECWKKLEADGGVKACVRASWCIAKDF